MLLKKSFFLLFLLIALVPFSYSQNESLYYADTLVLSVKLGSDFRLIPAGGKVDFVRANLNFYPILSPSQQIISIETNPVAKKEDESYVYYWDNPQLGKYEYSLKANVETHNFFIPIYEKSRFPITKYDPDLLKYAQPSEKIDITDDIIIKASDIAHGENDLFTVVFKLASWTKQNINYSLTSATAEASQKASWVLQNKYGVCDELTNLFIAMARALGIPARFVSGIAYSNSELFTSGWGLHGWAEVYFPEHGWIPFDPTYGQYGYVDATHIKLKDSIDSDKSSTKFEWQAFGVDLKPGRFKTDVSILKESEKAKKVIDISIKPFSKEVSFGSYNFLKADISNIQDYYVGFEASLIKPKEISIVGPTSKFIVLKPNEAKTYYWIVQVEKDLDDQYLYSFPVEISTSLGISGPNEFKSSEKFTSYSYNQILGLITEYEEQEEKIYSKNVDIICDSNQTLYIDETFRLNCDVKNEGNVFLKKLNVCMDNKCEQFDLGISQTKRVEFDTLLKKTGFNDLTVSGRNNQVSLLKMFKLYADDKPNITIEKIVLPDELIYGPEFEISFDLWKNSKSSPKNVTVDFQFNDKVTKWIIPELESNQGFDVKLDKTLLSLKDNNLAIKISYYDKNGNKFSNFFVSQIKLKEPGIFGKISIWIIQTSKKIEAMLNI